MTLLPDRAPISEGDIHQYLDSAICILGKASNQSYLDRDIIDHRVDQLQDKVDRGFNKADKHFTYVHKRFDKVEDSIKAVEKDVKSLKQEVKAVKEEVKAVKEDVKSLRTDMNERFKGIDCQFQENLAFQRNRLARVLDAEIERVSSFVKCGDGEMRAEVAIDFPTTIWQFWLLKTRSKIHCPPHFHSLHNAVHTDDVHSSCSPTPCETLLGKRMARLEDDGGGKSRIYSIPLHR